MSACIGRVINSFSAGLATVGNCVVRKASSYPATTGAAVIGLTAFVANKALWAAKTIYYSDVPLSTYLDTALYTTEVHRYPMLDTDGLKVLGDSEGATLYRQETKKVLNFPCTGFCTLKNAAITALALAAIVGIGQRYRA